MLMLLKLLFTVLLVIALLFAKTLLKLIVTRKQVDREIAQIKVEKILSPGSVKSLTVLPLVDFLRIEMILKQKPGCRTISPLTTPSCCSMWAQMGKKSTHLPCSIT